MTEAPPNWSFETKQIHSGAQPDPATGARATPIYSYVFDQTNYSIASGGTIDVQVFLQEDDSTGGSAFLHDPGLIGAGVYLIVV